MIPASSDEMGNKHSWKREAIRILTDEYDLSRPLATQTVAGFEEGMVEESSPREAVEEEMSYWGD